MVTDFSEFNLADWLSGILTKHVKASHTSGTNQAKNDKSSILRPLIIAAAAVSSQLTIPNVVMAHAGTSIGTMGSGNAAFVAPDLQANSSGGAGQFGFELTASKIIEQLQASQNIYFSDATLQYANAALNRSTPVVTEAGSDWPASLAKELAKLTD